MTVPAEPQTLALDRLEVGGLDVLLHILLEGLHSAVELLFGERLSGLRCDKHSVAQGLVADGRVGQVGKLQVELLDVDVPGGYI